MAGSSAANMPATSLSRIAAKTSGGGRRLRPSDRTPARRRRPGCAPHRAATRGRPRAGRRSRRARPVADAPARRRSRLAARRCRARRAISQHAHGDRGVRALMAPAQADRKAGGIRVARADRVARRGCARCLRSPRAASGSQRPDDDRHARLDDAGLLERDRRERRAEMQLMIEGDRRDRASAIGGRRRWWRRAGRRARPRAPRRRRPRARNSSNATAVVHLEERRLDVERAVRAQLVDRVAHVGDRGRQRGVRRPAGRR